MSAIITTDEAAVALGISARRVRALIDSGKLPATRMGRDWAILKTDLDQVAERKPGRPRKERTMTDFALWHVATQKAGQPRPMNFIKRGAGQTRRVSVQFDGTTDYYDIPRSDSLAEFKRWALETIPPESGDTFKIAGKNGNYFIE